MPACTTTSHSGRLDTIVLVNRVEELVAEMNISNGSLVSSLACDDDRVAKEISGDLPIIRRCLNKIRSRGDRDETFGGICRIMEGLLCGWQIPRAVNYRGATR
jgi:hypothetical protein